MQQDNKQFIIKNYKHIRFLFKETKNKKQPSTHHAAKFINIVVGSLLHTFIIPMICLRKHIAGSVIR